jgi:hypothetical protein
MKCTNFFYLSAAYSFCRFGEEMRPGNLTTKVLGTLILPIY